MERLRLPVYSYVLLQRLRRADVTIPKFSVVVVFESASEAGCGKRRSGASVRIVPCEFPSQVVKKAIHEEEALFEKSTRPVAALYNARDQLMVLVLRAPPLFSRLSALLF